MKSWKALKIQGDQMLIVRDGGCIFCLYSLLIWEASY
jgi:hypothetical protein